MLCVQYTKASLFDENRVEDNAGVRVIDDCPSVVIAEYVSRRWRSKQRDISLRQRLYLTVPARREIDAAMPRPVVRSLRVRMRGAVMFLQMRSVLCAELVGLVSSSLMLLLIVMFLGSGCK